MQVRFADLGEVKGTGAFRVKRDVVLACVPESHLATEVVRRAKRLADAKSAQLVVVHIQTPTTFTLPGDVRHAMAKAMLLAERVGADVFTQRTTNPIQAIGEICENRGVNTLVLGHEEHSPWHMWFHGSEMDGLLKRCGNVDVQLVTGRNQATLERQLARRKVESTPRTIAIAGAGFVAVTLISWMMQGAVGIAPIGIIYALFVVAVSALFGRMESIACAFLASVLFDLIFVSPSVGENMLLVRFLTTWAGLTFLAVVVQTLMTRLRDQVFETQGKSFQASALSHLTSQLLECRTTAEIATSAHQCVTAALDLNAQIYVVGNDDKLSLVPLMSSTVGAIPAPIKSVQAVQSMRVKLATRSGGSTFARGAYGYRVGTEHSELGVFVVALQHGRRLTDEEKKLLDAMAHQVVLGMERVTLEAVSRDAILRAETEKIRNALLCSVSHDIRTPLSIISMAAESLSHPETKNQDECIRLANRILHQVERLDGQVHRLLDFARLQAGAVNMDREWHCLDELISCSVESVESKFPDHRITVDVPENLPPVHVDGGLIEQAISNLVENAAKYSPPGSEILISAREAEGLVEIEVSDEGHGVDETEVAKLFTSFYRSSKQGGTGFGLGLAICQAVMTLHQGNVAARRREGHGSVFSLTFPLRVEVVREPDDLSFAFAREPQSVVRAHVN